MSASLFDLSGRAALVTGGSKGIGAAIAKGLALAGANVMIAARSEEDLRSCAASIQAEAGTRVVYRVTDMTDRDDVDALATAAVAEFGKVDILVNNAGSNDPQPLESLEDATWDRLVELNLTSCMRLSRALTPAMAERGWGRVINIASIMASVATAGRSTYCATKAGLLGMTRAQACELGPHGVTVNCISPGPILTDLPKRAFTQQQQATLAQYTALDRWGNPDELAGPALMLASDAGSYISGADLVVDGGTLAKAL
jgi:NAD(P)-dependent dehydrogenase (short-subunit alcohol dehydrogenase family)